MENTHQSQTVDMGQMYQYTLNLLRKGKDRVEVKGFLVSQGVGGQEADELIINIETELYTVKKSGSTNDMMIGGGICLIGIVLTITVTGYIFWEAILFGGIRFIRGVIKWAS